MVVLKILCYILASYGASYIVTNSLGPKNVFYRIRMWAKRVGPNFGYLFSCMICFPTNFGILFSLFDFFVMKNVEITPFNILFSDSIGIWWIILILMDGCFTGAICKIIYNIDDYIDKITPVFEDEE